MPLLLYTDNPFVRLLPIFCAVLAQYSLCASECSLERRLRARLPLFRELRLLLNRSAPL